MNKLTLYGRTRTGAIKVWSIWADEQTNTVHREWGLLNGVMTQSADPMTSRGKEGTKAYKTPHKVMLEEMTRLVTERQEKGMVEKIEDVQASVTDSDAIDFTALPTTFMPGKPVSSIADTYLDSVATARQWMRNGEAVAQRKRDGQRVWIANNEDGVINIFTRKHENITENIPLTVAAVRQLALPPLTMLDAELVVQHPDGSDHFKALRGLTGSKPDKANANERSQIVKLVLFDVLYYNGDETFKFPYRRRMGIIASIKALYESDRIEVAECWYDMDAALKALEESQSKTWPWEGFVVWKLDESTRIHFNGKEWRGNCYKLKAVKTNDFVATGWVPGKGRLSTSVGALKIAEYVDGKLVDLGTSGSGLTDKDREDILAGKWKFPLAVELEYDSRDEESFSLRFPVFIRFREDKPITECTRESNL